ncbi:MAG: DUF2812 domain-containing protein [Pseudomonadota bacterium]
MSGIVRKFKLHFVWQEDKEIAWLQQMASQGLHLKSANMACIYTFERGAPADISYRLDYQPHLRDDRAYAQLFEDAGWERVVHVLGWQYWRKAQQAGAPAEIFTDAASRRQLHWRVVRTMVLAISPLLLMLALAPKPMPDADATVVALAATGLIALYAWGFAMLFKRIGLWGKREA